MILPIKEIVDYVSVYCTEVTDVEVFLIVLQRHDEGYVLDAEVVAFAKYVD